MADIPLTGKDLKNIISEIGENPNLKFLNEIGPNSNIEDIFKHSGHCIFYHDWNDPQTPEGHWICVVRNHSKNNNNYSKEGEVLFFDSFGGSPDSFNKNLKPILQQNYNKVHHNNIKFQNIDASTCGRYCALVVGLNKIGLKPIQIIKLMKNIKDKKVDIDELLIKKIK